MGSHSYLINKKNENIYININGKLFSRNQAKISVFDSGFLLGDGATVPLSYHLGNMHYKQMPTSMVRATLRHILRK